jgi:hypothetical protein
MNVHFIQDLIIKRGAALNLERIMENEREDKSLFYNDLKKKF